MGVKDKYYVYEHWVGDTCIYVGSGSKYRPTEYKRTKEWYKFFPSKKGWDKIKHNIVSISYVTNDREDAYNKEAELTIKRKKEGHPLLNINIGKNKEGKNNHMYGIDLKDVMSEANYNEMIRKKKESVIGRKNPRATKIIELNRGLCFYCQKDASVFFGISKSRICDSIRLNKEVGRGKKYLFQKIEEEV